jgi:hypothetical protein
VEVLTVTWNVIVWYQVDATGESSWHLLGGTVWSNGGMIISIKEKGKEGEYGENPVKFHDSKQEFPKPHN